MSQLSGLKESDMLNNVQLIGRLGRDLELRHTQGGTAVARASLATSRYRRDAAGERREEVEWHQVVFWGRTAVAAQKVLAKGRLVFIQGRLRTRRWEAEDGMHYRTEVVVESWQVLDRRVVDADLEVEADADGTPIPALEAGAQLAAAGEADPDGIPF